MTSLPLHDVTCIMSCHVMYCTVVERLIVWPVTNQKATDLFPIMPDKKLAQSGRMMPRSHRQRPLPTVPRGILVSLGRVPPRTRTAPFLCIVGVTTKPDFRFFFSRPRFFLSMKISIF